eukprot:SAG22_NODE_558_length_9115_cov_15.267524_4_plen_1578_part_01
MVALTNSGVSGALVVVDISDQAQPVVTATESNSRGGLTAAEFKPGTNTLYVAHCVCSCCQGGGRQDWGGLEIWDLSDITDPRMVYDEGNYRAGSNADGSFSSRSGHFIYRDIEGVAATADAVVVAAGNDGAFVIEDVRHPRNPAEASVLLSIWAANGTAPCRIDFRAHDTCSGDFSASGAGTCWQASGQTCRAVFEGGATRNQFGLYASELDDGARIEHAALQSSEATVQVDFVLKADQRTNQEIAASLIADYNLCDVNSDDARGLAVTLYRPVPREQEFIAVCRYTGLSSGHDSEQRGCYDVELTSLMPASGAVEINLVLTWGAGVSRAFINGQLAHEGGCGEYPEGVAHACSDYPESGRPVRVGSYSEIVGGCESSPLTVDQQIDVTFIDLSIWNHALDSSAAARLSSLYASNNGIAMDSSRGLVLMVVTDSERIIHLPADRGGEVRTPSASNGPYLYVLDVATDLSAPALLATLEISPGKVGRQVKVVGNYAYVTVSDQPDEGDPGVRVIDLTDPSNPVMFAEDGGAHTDDHHYVATGTADYRQAFHLVSYSEGVALTDYTGTNVRFFWVSPCACTDGANGYICCLDPDTAGTWRSLTPPAWAQGRSDGQFHGTTHARTGSSIVADNGGYLYVAGGSDGFMSHASEFHRYDIAADTWQPLQALPRAVHGAAAEAVVAGKLYLIGGYSAGSSILSRVDVYSFADGTWSIASDMPTSRSSAGSASIGDTIFVIGGYHVSQSSVAVAEAYDTVTDTWSTLPPMPSPRYAPAAVARGGVIYVVGGRDLNVEGNPVVGALEAFTVATETWAELAPMPTSRYAFKAALHGHTIFAFGGGNWACSSGSFQTLATVEAYDIEAGAWCEAPPMPTPRYALGIATVDGVAYALGGFRYDCPDARWVPTHVFESFEFTDDDDCSPNPCQNGGACTDGLGSYTCSCTAGHNGDNCETHGSCAEVLAENPSAASGIYTIAVGGGDPLDAYCDMETEGGGWTLAAVSSDDGQHTWTWDNRHYIDTDTTVFGSLDHRNQDYKSAAVHSLVMNQILFVHHPTGVTAVYTITDGPPGGESLSELIQRHPMSCGVDKGFYELTSGTLTVKNRLCSTRLYVNPHDIDGGEGEFFPCNRANGDNAYGFAFSADQNNGCDLDDPGMISSLGPSSHEGGNVSEFNGRGYGWAIDGGRVDNWANDGAFLGGDGSATHFLQVYARHVDDCAVGARFSDDFDSYDAGVLSGQGGWESCDCTSGLCSSSSACDGQESWRACSLGVGASAQGEGLCVDGLDLSSCDTDWAAIVHRVPEGIFGTGCSNRTVFFDVTLYAAANSSNDGAYLGWPGIVHSTGNYFPVAFPLGVGWKYFRGANTSDGGCFSFDIRGLASDDEAYTTPVCDAEGKQVQLAIVFQGEQVWGQYTMDGTTSVTASYTVPRELIEQITTVLVMADHSPGRVGVQADNIALTVVDVDGDVTESAGHGAVVITWMDTPPTVFDPNCGACPPDGVFDTTQGRCRITDYASVSPWSGGCPRGTYGVNGQDCEGFGQCQECAAPGIVDSAHQACTSCAPGQEPNADRTDCVACTGTTHSGFGAEC